MDSPSWLLVCASLACLCSFVGAQASEGTKFALALSVSNCPRTYEADLSINARHTTPVTISTSLITDVITVYGNSSTVYTVPQSMRTEYGIEDKGIMITSEEPVTIHVSVTGTSYDYHMPDSFLLRSITERSTVHYLAGYNEMYTGTDSNTAPHAYFMVVATENDTDVRIGYAHDTVVETFTVNKFDVLTRGTYYMSGQPELDFTGTSIIASKPVAVYSGVSSVYLYAAGGSAAETHIVEPMPTVGELGTEYTSFPIHFGGDGGYEIRVIAVENGTLVVVPAFSTSLTLDAGQFYIINNIETMLGFKMSCSKPCMAIQYVRSLPAGGDTGIAMGPFMAVLLGQDNMLNNQIFSVPSWILYDSNSVAALSIIVNTYPVTGLYLNDISLANLDWQPVEDSSNWFATVEVVYGFYDLYSTEPSERFAAYLYVVMASNLATGHPLGYWGEYSPTDPPPTTPPPQTPFYTVLLLGNFTSHDGSDFSVQCTLALGSSFQTKAVQMVPSLNNMIGQDMCQYVDTGDVWIVTVAAVLTTDESTGFSEITYMMEAATYVSISNLTSCAGEMNLYLQDFFSWGVPVVPPVTNCPMVVFDPGYFIDGSDVTDGSNWYCLPSSFEDVVQVFQDIDAPSYGLSIYDNFTTADGSDMTEQCAQVYRGEWQYELATMGATLNEKVANGELCPEDDGRVTVGATTALFVAQGQEGAVTGTFIMELTTDHILFDDVHGCVNEMLVFANDKSNWGDGPLLPQQPGCPFLIFLPPTFYFYGESWLCP